MWAGRTSLPEGSKRGPWKMMSYRLRRNRLLAPQLARLPRPHRSPRPLQLHQVLAPIPRLAPSSQINFSGSPLNTTAGLPVIRAESQCLLGATVLFLLGCHSERHPNQSRLRLFAPTDRIE